MERNRGVLAYIMKTDGTAAVENIPVPQCPKDGLVVKIHNATICGTDFRTFMKGNGKITPPRVLGHEMAGTVAAVGPEANSFREGDRVTMAPAIGCGKCWPCSTGHTNMCDNLNTMGFQYDGSFAEYMAIPGHALRMGAVIGIADAIPFEEACLAEPAACVLNAHSYLNIGADDYVVVYGSGFIGCMHAEFALAAGARQVIMVEIAESRLAIAKQMIPSIETINPARENTLETVREMTGGRGANVVITALSVPSVHSEAQQIAAKMGRISLFGGIAGEGKGYLDSNLIHYKELSMFGVHATTPKLLREVLKAVETGTVNMGKYISHHYPLRDIVDGFIAIRDENAMKVVVAMD